MTSFTYVYDTYCGWCYGAARVVEALIDSGAEVTVLHRHLFQGPNAHRLADGFGAAAERHDQRIAALTGQAFSTRYVENVLRAPAEVLDNTLTAQAAALVHDQGAQVEMALAHQLQKARFVEGHSAADADHVVRALAEFGVTDPLDSGRAVAATLAASAAEAQARMGAQGVPTLVRHAQGTASLVPIDAFYEIPETIAALAA